ncbi:NYN domain-containing protein [Domibacillus sp. A3M-37]|uniref:NYN domain-containing protein n=1 Tax=Domibacillus TaxID=1433999 RepID=UPI000617D43F|nr:MULTISPECIES: NYN domain-containing protein [Domibacillus]MCP3764424.1 NYN domain-containing protein [Domibacillus sp. A3M-37]
MDILLIDGYNMIGAWPELRQLKDTDFAGARDRLVTLMAEYQGVHGCRVIIVFDAHFVKGTEKKYRDAKVEVIFTRENETADERIEKMAIELNNVRDQVTVATSDFTEQWAVFGQGALRVSARELLTELSITQKAIRKNLGEISHVKPQARIPLSKETAETFEKWRRGKK